jgi:hypothetical protein
MAEKPLQIVSGIPTEVEAQTSSAGAGDAGKIIALDNTGRIDDTMMPVGIAADVNVVDASEALAAGDLVNIWDDTGTPKARKADASAVKPADGFVLAAVDIADPATVYSEGTNDQVTGLTGGTEYFLSATTPGGVSATAPTGTGQIVQRVGKAFSATSLNFQKGDIFKRA